jgi:hypothetical protein
MVAGVTDDREHAVNAAENAAARHRPDRLEWLEWLDGLGGLGRLECLECRERLINRTAGPPLMERS